MEKEKVVFFLDYANINRAAKEKRYRLDYCDLLQYMGEERFLIDAHCYVPINPRNEHRLDGEIEELWRSGYIVTTKVGTIAGGTYKCNFDVEVTTGTDIRLKCSGFIDLAVYYEGYLAAQNGEQGEESIEEQYKDLIQSQNGEQDEGSIEEQYKDLIQSPDSDLDEDDVKVTVDQVGNETSIPVSDPIDELDL